MAVNDHSANRQAQSHPAWLCGHERVEHFVQVLCIDARAGILDLHANRLVPIPRGSHRQHPTIVLDGVSMAWDGAGNRYYCLQSIVKARGNAKVAIVYVERGADYGTDLTGKEIMRVEEIVSHPHIKIRPDGQSAFVLGATREGKIHLSDDIPGWVGKP